MYKIGDRIIVTAEDYGDEHFKHMSGTIIGFGEYPWPFEVMMDNGQEIILNEYEFMLHWYVDTK